MGWSNRHEWIEYENMDGYKQVTQTKKALILKIGGRRSLITLLYLTWRYHHHWQTQCFLLFSAVTPYHSGASVSCLFSSAGPVPWRFPTFGRRRSRTSFTAQDPPPGFPHFCAPARPYHSDAQRWTRLLTLPHFKALPHLFHSAGSVPWSFFTFERWCTPITAMDPSGRLGLGCVTVT